MSRVLLGVSGGIAAYKSLELTRLAIKAGHAVRVIQTEASLRFVGAASFEGITGAPVLTSEFERDPLQGRFPGDEPASHDPIGHLALVAAADVYLIAPASANTIAKLAHGQADNLLTTAALAARCPVAVAPAMNDAMYRHPATQANLELLRSRGVAVVEPGSGSLASLGEHGIGRLPEPADLLARVEELLARGAASGGPWTGRRVLVTAGGTREPIDSVRFIGNRSSGRMGYALATEAARRGAEVTLIAANVDLPAPAGVIVHPVVTAAELRVAAVESFAACDVLLMAAAVADFRPAEAAAGKLKKDRDAPESLALERTADILSELSAERRPGQTLVGFAAEHGEGAVDYGRGKLERKRLDAVVVNDIARPEIGFESPDNEVTIVTAAGERRVPLAGKAQVAAAILDVVEELRAAAAGSRNMEDGGTARSAAARRTAGA